MIDRALLFLRDQLNEHLARTGGGPEAGLEDPIAFVDGDKLDPLTLKAGVVNLLLVNMEQELVMRPGDPFARALGDGSVLRVQPGIRLNLLVLFVARFRVYEAGLAALSGVLRFFQANRLFEARTSPDLDPRIERLVVELRTLPLNEQNDLWGSLRLAYHPSLMFRVRMIAVEDESVAMPATPIAEPMLEVAHADPAGR